MWTKGPYCFCNTSRDELEDSMSFKTIPRKWTKGPVHLPVLLAFTQPWVNNSKEVNKRTSSPPCFTGFYSQPSVNNSKEVNKRTSSPPCFTAFYSQPGVINRAAQIWFWITQSLLKYEWMNSSVAKVHCILPWYNTERLTVRVQQTVGKI